MFLFKIFFSHILSFLIFLPLISIFLLFFINKNNKIQIYTIGLWSSIINLFFSTFLWIFFDNSTTKFQFIETFSWLPNYNINFYLGIDGISLFFILLTTLLIPLCILSSIQVIKNNIKEYIILFLLLEIFLILIFSILDLILFYIFFESILIPMFFIIGIWGSRKRKIRANYLFFLYTLFGSVLMLLAILYILIYTGTTDYQLLLSIYFTSYQQYILWLAFFISFAIKIPIIPFHIWLPEAHVEAPTSGSVILASLLLKLGTYGFIRFLIPLFPIATIYFTPFVLILSLIGIIYPSLIAIRQIDLKKIIAYASIAHMNIVLIGLFSLNIYGIKGAILQMLSHGLISGALFLCIGILYDRYHTRLLTYYSGLAYVMPLFIIIFLFFILANIAVPGTSSFISEFLILNGIFQYNIFITILASSTIILGAIYSLWLYNRISFGSLKINYIEFYLDLTKREFFIFCPLIFLILIMGIYSELFFKAMNLSLINLIEHINLQL